MDMTKKQIDMVVEYCHKVAIVLGISKGKGKRRADLQTSDPAVHLLIAGGL